MMPPLALRSPDHPRIGFGAMHLSERHRPARAVAIETVHAALDAGVRLVDTADAYCQHAGETGHNETLVAEALASWDGDRAAVTVATKGGHVRDRDGRWSVDGRPEHLIAAALASRSRLGVDSIALYQWHRPDPAVSLESSVCALADLQDDGVVVDIGLSNVDVPQLERAGEIIDVATVQNELSPMALQSLPVLDWCHQHEVPFIVWAPFGGRGRVNELIDDPQWEPVRDVAGSLDASVPQIVLAWLLSLSPMVVPIPGASRPTTIVNSVAADRIALDGSSIEALDRAVLGTADRHEHDWLERIRSRRIGAGIPAGG